MDKNNNKKTIRIFGGKSGVVAMAKMYILYLNREVVVIFRWSGHANYG